MKNILIMKTVKEASNTIGAWKSLSVARPLPIVKKGTTRPIIPEVSKYHFIRLPAG
jgi:hypothetical protein